ncbi:MAG: YMGG-like glycine zipper-containing protein [Deltaproteobacteria bacterium]|nr:YMGG-like glycine zipper-containing protein [Deltaproteobacteria bacterium]
MKKCVSLLMTGMMVLLCSCETVSKHEGATTGAALGAGVGAVVGAVAAPKGKTVEGAIIGGLAGALVGGTIGHYAYDVKRNQAETNRVYNFSGREATARIEEVSISPKTVKPGEKVATKLTYAVLTTSNLPVKVKEVREIYFMGELWGNPEVTVERTGGTYVSDLPIILPKDARKGTYKVKFTVLTEMSKDTREATFTVQ